MSTPQDPGGDPPQDPADPQNPYDTQPPPPQPSDPPTTAIPPPPPVYGTEPGGAPTTPPPPAPTPPPAPPYGDPAAPTYGQPSYAQPAQPAYAQPVPQYGATAPDQPGKGMAIAALIISFFGCVVLGALIAIPLAVVVLLRSRDGRNHGKGLAIAAIVVSLVTLAIPVIGVVAGVSYVSSLTDVNDLEPGDCITAKGLTDSSSDSVTEIKSVSCSHDHDGEVLATLELTQQQADDYATTPFSEICDPAIADEGKTEVLSETVTYTALTVADPEEGDTAACVAYNADGSKLTSELGS
jgi:hypothetical protein